MNTNRIQQLLDQLLATSAQRFAFAFAAMVSVVGASWIMALSTVRPDAFLVVFCGFLALVVVIEPDEHLGAIVIGLVVLQWLGTGADVTSPGALALACALFGFHTTVALMAVTPHTSTVPANVLASWLTRSVAVVVSTGAVWVLVVVFDRREAPGNVTLTVMCIAALAAAVLLIRDRSVPTRPAGSDQH